MLFGGYAWSELPISTQGRVELNGEVIEYTLVIDEYHNMSVYIDVQKGFDLTMSEQVEFQLNDDSNSS